MIPLTSYPHTLYYHRMENDNDYDEPENEDLPVVSGPKAVKDLLGDYELNPFTSDITADSSHEQTAVADVNQINNHLAVAHGLLPEITTIQGFCALSVTVCKLIEYRRKVKKLPFGEPAKGGGSSRGFTVLD